MRKTYFNNCGSGCFYWTFFNNPRKLIVKVCVGRALTRRPTFVCLPWRPTSVVQTFVVHAYVCRGDLLLSCRPTFVVQAYVCSEGLLLSWSLTVVVEVYFCRGGLHSHVVILYPVYITWRSKLLGRSLGSKWEARTLCPGPSASPITDSRGKGRN